MKPSLRPLRQDDSLEALTALLHRSYRSLAEMGLRYWATHQSVENTKERVARGQCFVIEAEGALVATITYYKPSQTSGCPYYERPEVASFGQLGVDPTYRRQGLAAQLISHAEARATKDGAAYLALDTAIPATHLIALYQRRGYAIVEEAQWEGVNYRSVIMSLPLLVL